MTRLEDLLADAVGRHGARTAVEDADGSVTYDDLWRQAHGYAAELVRRDARRVALQVPSSARAVALYLGVLVAGGTVVPLGPALPRPRVERAVRTGRVDLVVTAAAAPSVAGVEVVPAGDLRAAADGASGVTRHADLEDHAYVIFTSGSTGAPKGVPIGHDNVCAFLAAAAPRFGFDHDDRVSQFFDLSFDVSVFDLFATLTCGATLVVPTQADRLRPARWVRDRGLTRWAGVPSSVALAVRTGELGPGAMPGLRTSTFIGERLSAELADRWAAATPNGEVVNFYGPAEATVGVTSHTLARAAEDRPATRNGSVPIGTAFDGVEWRLDPVDGRPAEAGTGELLLRGPQVFGGYLGVDPAHRVAPDADGWYHTGDVVTEEDGLLVHLGRVDDQVKVGGHRIEIMDVETHAGNVPGVDQAAVTTVTSEGVTTLHVVFVGDDLSARDLRRALSAELPPYMLPSGAVRVDALPLTPSGKLDRVAVAAIAQDAR